VVSGYLSDFVVRVNGKHARVADVGDPALALGYEADECTATGFMGESWILFQSLLNGCKTGF
jgi:hypothetical protein